MQAQTPASLFFGKLPCRGDFLRSAHTPALIQAIDRWLTQSLEVMSADTHWKALYDRIEPMRFAFLGSRSHRGMAGYLIASHDESGRRFPFVNAHVLEIEHPERDLKLSPLWLSETWSELARQTSRAFVATDSASAQHELVLATHASRPSESAARAYQSFLEEWNIGALEGELGGQSEAFSLRKTILGLGMLLQPVPASGVSRLDKGLVLPLPANARLQAAVAAFWLDLIGDFLGRADFELVVCLPQSATPPTRMALGFAGASAQLLPALNELVDDVEAVFVDIRQADWVEDYVDEDYAAKKLSSYLLQPGLSLAQAVKTFKETFLGL
jgi:type VI secretion system protein ImpM